MHINTKVGIEDILQDAGIERGIETPVPPTPEETPPAPVAEETPAEPEPTPTPEETPPVPVAEETPPAEPEPTPEPKSDDYSQVFLKEFNEKASTTFGSMDDLYAEFKDVKSLRESAREMKAQMANFKNPLAEDEQLAKLYQFRKETGRDMDDFFLIDGKDFKAMKPMDAMVLEEILMNPGYRGQESLVREALEKRYGYDPDADERDQRITQFNIDSDGNKAKQRLIEIQDKITVPEFSDQPAQLTEEMKQEMTKNLDTWKATIPKLVDDFMKFPVYSSQEAIDQGKDPLAHIDILDDERSKYKNALMQHIEQSNIPPTEENLNRLNQLMINDFILNNYMRIAGACASVEVEKNNNMWKERTGQDPNKLKDRHRPPGTGSTKEKVDEFNKNAMDQTLNKLRIKI